MASKILTYRPILYTGTEKPEAIELARLASGFSGNDLPQTRRRYKNKVQINCTHLKRVSQSFFLKDQRRQVMPSDQAGKQPFYAYLHQ
jgi:hypothetical protein